MGSSRLPMAKTGKGRAAATLHALDIAGAVRILKTQPSIGNVSKPVEDAGGHRVDFEVAVDLWSNWAAAGQSPNGVRRSEPVSLWFPREFPLQAPAAMVREDFDCSKAHIIGIWRGRPLLCLFDGDPDEVLHERGFVEFANQIPRWLFNAAYDTLIQPTQGWEPVRRDHVSDMVIADPSILRRAVEAGGGSACFVLEFMSHENDAGKKACLGTIGPERVTVTAENPGALFAADRSVPKFVSGKSIAILVWPGPGAAGKPFIAGNYLPESVTDLGGLKARAELYGCGAQLEAALDHLQVCLTNWGDGLKTLPVAVVLVARRPMPIIGSTSDLELCPYLVEIAPPQLFPNANAAPIRPMALRDAISPGLLRRISGLPEGEGKMDWTLLGAGSLGAKIGMHSARAGLAPARIIDSRALTPHNAARHALIPGQGSMQTSWMGWKANSLAAAMKGLGKEVTANNFDVVPVLRDRKLAKQYLPKNSNAIVNTTASLTVREAIAATPENVNIPRVIEVGLMGRTRIGYVTVEGPGRNPNSGELFSELNELMRADPDLRKIAFEENEGFERRRVGDGCSSVTLTVSDAQISMFAAPMATTVTKLLLEKLPKETGRMMIGKVGLDGISLAWSSIEMERFQRVKTDDKTWTVSLSPRADAKIEAEVRQYRKVETGGVLVGRVSEAARTFYVTDAIPAPPDSKRSADEFVLGTKGLLKTIDAYTASTKGALYCIGTWHSHVAEFGASERDKATARELAAERMAPSIMLIRTPGGYRALATTELLEEHEPVRKVS